MEHPEFWPLIDAHVDGNLAGEDADRLLAHVEGCDDCRRRVAGAQKEASAWQRAPAAPVPPENLMQNIMAGIGTRHRSRSAARFGPLAGVIANIVTAAVLVLVSLGTGAQLGEMVLLALAVALIWGGIKGFAFVQLLRFLPRHVVSRAAVFGVGTWIVTVVLLAVSSLAGATSDLSVPFLVIGSLVHSLLYGLLLSWIYEWLVLGTPPGWPMNPVARLGGTTLLVLVLLAISANGVLARAPLQTGSVEAVTPSPTETQVLVTDTPTETVTPFPNSAQPTATVAIETPTSAPTSTPTTTASPATSATPRPTAAPQHRAKRPSRTRARLSAGEEVRSILPSIVNPRRPRSAVQRVHDVVVLLNFL